MHRRRGRLHRWREGRLAGAQLTRFALEALKSLIRPVALAKTVRPAQRMKEVVVAAGPTACDVGIDGGVGAVKIVAIDDLGREGDAQRHATNCTLARDLHPGEDGGEAGGAGTSWSAAYANSGPPPLSLSSGLAQRAPPAGTSKV